MYFVGISPFSRVALQVAIATIHFHKVKTCASFRNIFSYLGGPKVHFDTRKNCPTGARKAKLEYIRGLGHL